MKYALLVYSDQSAWDGIDDEEAARLRAESMPRWLALFEEMGKADPGVEGRELEAASEAKVVRVVGGERVVTDGPFAETKEQIGGLFLTALPDLDEAIRIAALVPPRSTGRSRSALSWSGDALARGHVQGGVAPCGRDPHTCPRRPLARRGRGAGRLHDCARAVAARRDAPFARRMDRHHRAEQRRRPHPS
jgi:hypothetical protein